MRALRMIMVAGAAALLMVLVGVPLANAAKKDCPHQMGSHQRLSDAGGAVVQEWTITGLHKSADGAPGYPVAGQLWEATASVHAVSGTVTPVIPNLAAVSGSEEHYRTLWQLASPAGLSGATLAEGQSSTGKVYFDVTGGAPAMVVYQNGAMPELMWCDEAAMKSTMATMKTQMKSKSGDCCDDMAAAKESGDCACCADMA